MTDKMFTAKMNDEEIKDKLENLYKYLRFNPTLFCLKII